jgi:hypothetical protein
METEHRRDAEPSRKPGRTFPPVTLNLTPAPPLEHPAPHVKHAPEPDAENLMPAEHRLGTL